MEFPHPLANSAIDGAPARAADGWGGPHERHGGGTWSAAAAATATAAAPAAAALAPAPPVAENSGGRGHLWITFTCGSGGAWKEGAGVILALHGRGGGGHKA